MRAALLIMLMPVAFCQNSTPPPAAGSVQGFVLDAANKPVVEAIVFGLPEENMRHQIKDKTGPNGEFTLSNVPGGGIYIDAYKESEGYPYSFFSFFKIDERPVKVAVVAGQVTKDVIIRLGAKAAYLNVDITDPDGKPPADPASLVFSRDDIPGTYKSGAGAKESVMVPPVPFRFAVEVSGYKPWHYGGDEWQGNKGLIALKPGESKNLTVHLVRQ